MAASVLLPLPVDPGGPVTGVAPPYPPGTLHPPLSHDERQNVVTYLQSSAAFDFAAWWRSLTRESTDKYINAGKATGAVAQDYVVVAQYNRIAKGQSANPPEQSGPGALPGGNVITGVADFLRLLTNPHTWVRVAEFAVGGILIAVGTNAMLRQGMGSGAPQIRPPRTGMSYGRSFK